MPVNKHVTAAETGACAKWGQEETQPEAASAGYLGYLSEKVPFMLPQAQSCGPMFSHSI